MWDEKRWQEFKEEGARRRAAKEAAQEAARQHRARIRAIRNTQLPFFDVRPEQPVDQAQTQDATPEDIHDWLTGFEQKAG